MQHLEILPNLKGKTAVIYERIWLLEELEFLKESESYHVLAIDRRIYLKDGYVFTAMQGSSMIASLAERFIRAGVRRIIRIGTTGSLHDEHKLFEIIIPMAVYKDEGTSNQYVDGIFPCLCDLELSSKLCNLLHVAGHAHYRGITWTTDGRWVESLDKMHKLKKWGVLAVDMETSALYTVCLFNKIPCIALNFVSDFPMKSEKNGLRGVPNDYEIYKKELLKNVDKVTQLIVKEKI